MAWAKKLVEWEKVKSFIKPYSEASAGKHGAKQKSPMAATNDPHLLLPPHQAKAQQSKIKAQKNQNSNACAEHLRSPVNRKTFK